MYSPDYLFPQKPVNLEKPLLSEDQQKNPWLHWGTRWPKSASRISTKMVSPLDSQKAVFHCHIRLMRFCEGTWEVEVFSFNSRHTHTKYVYLAILGDFFWMVSSRDPFQRFRFADLNPTRGSNLAHKKTRNNESAGTQDTLLWFCGTLGCFECHKTPPGLGGGGFKRFSFHAEPWGK